MVAVQEVEAEKLIVVLKEELKKVDNIKPPAWAAFAKSGVNRERPPVQKDFWYIRAASLLRRVYVNGPIGVGRLTTFYGGRKRGGTKPAHFRRSSGSMLRKMMQQLEIAGLVEKTDVKGVKGRKISPAGRKLLDKVAYEVSKSG
jgi:small subunit ribosomal protein S19e